MARSAWPLSVVSGILLFIHVALRFYYGGLEDGFDIVSLGLIVLGLSPWIARIVESLEIGGLKMRFFQEQLDKQKRELEAISFMLTHYLPFWELHHLKYLAEGAGFIVGPDSPDYNPASFERELRHLRELGLIALRSSMTIMEMCRLPGQINVHDYAYVTDRGRQYLALRAELMKAPPAKER